MKKQVLLERLNKLIEPIVIGLGYELYHIEYKKEDGEYYLRVYIDKEGGINLTDCERVSRPISDMLDIEDPIPDSYYLEVSSPGVFRELFNDRHLEKYIGSTVKIVFNGAFNGEKSLIGDLKAFDNDNIYINDDNTKVPREKIKSISLEGSLKEGNTNE